MQQQKFSSFLTRSVKLPGRALFWQDTCSVHPLSSCVGTKKNASKQRYHREYGKIKYLLKKYTVAVKIRSNKQRFDN